MCREVLKVELVMMLLLSTACSAFMSSLQSRFFSRFSLRELVERTEAKDGLSCSGGGAGGGGGGISMGTGGINPHQSNFHKSESLACQITDAELFDEAKFLEALKTKLENDLIATKSTVIRGKNADATSISLEYYLDDIAGTVEISGKKGPMNYYSLSASLSEKSK